jgi:hypothetical protein
LHSFRNSTLDIGGGAYGGTLRNCTLSGNSASGEDSYYGMGGGAGDATLYNCILTNNSANYSGGGSYGGTMNNCALIANTAGMYGGGAANTTLNNCTLTGNSASQGGGTAECTLNNCINYYNSAGIGANQLYSYMAYCCTTPAPGPESSSGGNISSEPQLADAFHLSAASPCRNAGSAAYATGLEMDGEPWANPPSIGCDEYYAGAITGSLAVAIQASYTNVAAGFAVDFAAVISGHAAASRWDFGGGIVMSNQSFPSHSWATLGDHVVTLTGYNESNPGGVSATVTVHVVEATVHYVSIGSASPAAPFTSWATAAANIQDAIDATSLPGSLVMVSNGVYNTGGKVAYGAMTNRVAVTKPVTVQSVNGSAVTVIEGNPILSSAVRGVYLTNGAALKGFTVTRGATINSGDETREMTGAGIWCPSTSALVSDCLVISNSAYWDCGGVVGGTLSNCTIAGNAGHSGGGAAGGTLNNCTLTNNSAGSGGGLWLGTANNCILIGNISTGGSYGGGK